MEFFKDNFVLFLAIAVVIAPAVTFWGNVSLQMKESAYDRVVTWFCRFLGFLCALVILPTTPFFLVGVYKNWGNDQTGIIAFVVVIFLGALVASIYSAVTFPVATFKVIRNR